MPSASAPELGSRQSVINTLQKNIAHMIGFNLPLLIIFNSFKFKQTVFNIFIGHNKSAVCDQLCTFRDRTCLSHAKRSQRTEQQTTTCDMPLIPRHGFCLQFS